MSLAVIRVCLLDELERDIELVFVMTRHRLKTEVACRRVDLFAVLPEAFVGLHCPEKTVRLSDDPLLMRFIDVQGGRLLPKTYHDQALCK
jgi:ABC-type transporter Mla maintaining outer membrane lipid asymmetry ATPase subunit MlaF